MELDTGLIDLLYVASGAAIALVMTYIWGLFKARPDYDEIEQMTRRMVEAAQQMWELSNEEKYAYVSDTLSKWLKMKGWDISPELIQVFIESAVRLLRREEKVMGIDLENFPEDEEIDFKE